MTMTQPDVLALWKELEARVAAGDRFAGLFATSATGMLLSPARDGAQTAEPGEPSAWMVVPVLAGLAVLFLLGIHPPGELTSLITHAAAQLGAR